MPEAPLRLEAAPHFRLPNLGDLGGGHHVRDEGRAQLVTVYWDTADLRLARWGASLLFNPDEGWRVRQPPAGGATGAAPAVPGDPEVPPPQALDLLRGYIRGASLVPAARVRRIRRTVVVLDEAEQEVLRVQSDEVSVLDGRRVAVRYRQAILEPVENADIGLIHSVLTRLRAAGAGGPDTTDEHARVMGPAATQAAEVTTTSLGPGSTLGEAVSAMIAASVIRLLTHDAGVRAGEDPEAVHQARVATRRLRSDLDTFSAVLDAAALRRHRAELKWLAALLGDVRDAEVLMARLRRRLEEADGLAAGARLSELLAERRLEGRRRLLAAMHGARYTRLLDALVELAREPPLALPAETPAADVLPGLVAGPWRRLKKSVEKLPRHPPDADLHAVRIGAKRLRYASEAAAPVIGADAERLAGAAADVQGVLGDFNDAVVARQWLVAVAPGLESATAFFAGVVSERERALAEASAGQWKDAWKQASRPKLTRWLSDA